MNAHLSPLASWLIVAMLLALIPCGLYLAHLLTAHAAAEGTGPACRPPLEPTWPDGGTGGFADLFHDDYAEASEQALAVANNLIAADGCHSADHLLGVHSAGWPFNRPALPVQRDGRA